MSIEMRYDSYALSLTPTKLTGGENFLAGDLFAASAGIVEYNHNGKISRELRRPEEIFDPKSMESLKLVPITYEHPPKPSDPTKLPVRSDNVKKLMIGTIGEKVRKHTDNLRLVANHKIMDQSSINRMIKNQDYEVSPAFTAKMVEIPGIWNGVPYDREQTNIRYNHVAVTHAGRAGNTELVMDSADSATSSEIPVGRMLRMDSITVTTTRKTNTNKPKGVKMLIDGKQYDGIPEPVEAYVEKLRSQVTELGELKTEKARIEGRMDSLQSQLTEAQSVDVTELINERLGLIEDIKPVFKDDMPKDILRMDSKDIKIATIKKLKPDVDASDWDVAYIDGYLKGALEAYRADSAQKTHMNLTSGVTKPSNVDDMYQESVKKLTEGRK